jgi:hypothetical protein
MIGFPCNRRPASPKILSEESGLHSLRTSISSVSYPLFDSEFYQRIPQRRVEDEPRDRRPGRRGRSAHQAGVNSFSHLSGLVTQYEYGSVSSSQRMGPCPGGKAASHLITSFEIGTRCAPRRDSVMTYIMRVIS